MSGLSLGTVMGVQTTLLAVSATQAASRFCPVVRSVDGTAGATS